MDTQESNKILVNSIKGMDVVRAVAALKSSGELNEEITLTNYKQYAQLVGTKVWSIVKERSDVFDSITERSAEDICTRRASGLLRYLVVRDRL